MLKKIFTLYTKFRYIIIYVKKIFTLYTKFRYIINYVKKIFTLYTKLIAVSSSRHLINIMVKGEKKKVLTISVQYKIRDNSENIPFL